MGNHIVEGKGVRSSARRLIVRTKKTEGMLWQNRQRLQAIVDLVPISAAVCQTHNRQIVCVNPQFQDKFGWAPQPGHDRALEELCLHPSDQAVITALGTTACLSDLQVEVACQDGRTLWVQISMQPMPGKNQQFSVVVFSEIARPQETAIAPASSIVLPQTQREQMLNRVIQTVRKSLDLKTIFYTAVEETTHILGANRASIFQYLPEQGLWVNVADYSADANASSALGLELPDTGNSIAAKLKQRQVVRLINAAEAEDEMNRVLSEAYPGAWLIVPLYFDPNASKLASPTVWGGLALVRTDARFHWQESEVDLANAIADQLSIAIHQAELHRHLHRLNADLERQVQARTAQLQLASDFEATLKRITDKVRDSLDEDQILHTAVQELAIAIGVNCCNAALYDLEEGTSTVCYEYTTENYSFRGRVARMADYPELYNQLLKGMAFEFCSIFPNPVRGRVVMLACPMRDDQGVLGDLWLVTQQYSTFTEQDIRLVEQVANQCAIALRQSRLYQAAQAQVAELERLNRLKDDFLSTVSHELRTPMANIKMATQMLEIILKQSGLFDSSTKPVARYFKILNDECTRETNLINDLLDLSRLESEAQPLTLTTLNLYTWLPHLIAPFLERVDSQQQQLVLDLPPGLPHLTTDLAELERILAELLNNACKYTPPEGTITLAVSLLSHLESQSESPVAQGRDASTAGLAISVMNSGVEIPASELSHLFDKFYRLPNSDPWRYSGTGLGLALVKKLTERLGGTIQATSAANHTCFTLEIPVTCCRT